MIVYRPETDLGEISGRGLRWSVSWMHDRQKPIEENKHLRLENVELTAKVEWLTKQVDKLTAALEEARRAGKRQAAPFRKKTKTQEPKNLVASREINTASTPGGPSPRPKQSPNTTKSLSPKCALAVMAPRSNRGIPWCNTKSRSRRIPFIASSPSRREVVGTAVRLFGPA